MRLLFEKPFLGGANTIKQSDYLRIKKGIFSKNYLPMSMKKSLSKTLNGNARWIARDD